MRRNRTAVGCRHTALLAGFVFGVLAFGAAGCGRGGVPFDAATSATVGGTIAGRVQGVGGALPIGRAVEAVNLATGARHLVTTDELGEFAFLLAPGTYFIEVEVRDGEMIVRRPEPVTVRAGERASAGDFVLAGGRILAPRRDHLLPAPGGQLGPPVAWRLGRPDGTG